MLNTTFVNSTFESRPKGTAKFETVCKSLNVKRFFRFKPAPGKTMEQDWQCLDPARFRETDGKPRRFRTLTSMMLDIDAWTRQEMPIAIMGYKNQEEQQKAVEKGLHERNASMHCGYSFLGGMTFPKLLQAYRTIDPKYMWMCAMVLDDAPVHLYFDFDASLSTTTTTKKNLSQQQSAAQVLAQRVQNQEKHVKREFCATFDQFFRQTYGRSVNWGGMHWETASDSKSGKFSLHAHLTTEAFINIQHMRRFMEAYVSYVDQQSAVGNVKWLQHADATLLDGAVYTPNRVFRLVGCRKLHKTELCPMPSTEAESLLGWEELVFRGMPSLSIDVEDKDLLSFASTSVGIKKRKQPQSQTGACDGPRQPSKAIASSNTTAEQLTALHRIFVDLRVLGPNPEIAKCQTVLFRSSQHHDAVVKRFQGEFVLRSAWCPNCTKYHSMHDKEPHIHENTPMAFCVTTRGVTISDFRCGTDKKQHFVPAAIGEAWSTLFANAPEQLNSIPATVTVTDQSKLSAEPEITIIDTLDDTVMSSDSIAIAQATDGLDSNDHDDHDVAIPASAEAVTSTVSLIESDDIDAELQPSLVSLQQIVQEQVEQQRDSFDALKMQMQIGVIRRDQHIIATCEDTALSMDAAVELSVVTYLNRFWARFLRLGKPWMVQELGSRCSSGDQRIRWEASFNSLKHLEEIYSNLNIQLPNYAQALQQQQSNRKRRNTSVNAAGLWLNHPASRRLNGIEFDPQKPAILFRNSLPAASSAAAATEGNYNLWRGFAITREMADQYQAQAAAQLAAPLLNHIRQVWCRNSQVSYDYVISWMANVIQKRGKNATALVVKGPQGAGKGIVVQKLGEIIGREADHFFHAHNMEDVLGTYTHNLRATCLAFLDEVTYGGNHEQAQRLKKLVTESTHSINAKYQPSYTVDSYLNIIIASNDAFVVPCETRQRRFMALEIDDSRCGRQTKELKQYYDEILKVPAAAFAHVLYHRDLSQFNPREIHATEFERDQKIRSFGPMMAWWHDCLQEDHIEGAVIVASESDPTAAAASSMSNTAATAFGALVVKDSMYNSFAHFCSRNRRGSTYQITAKNEFWKLLDAWTQTSGRVERQVHLAHPELKRQVLDTNGLKVWTRVVLLPNLDECREAWKDRVVFDSEWTFQ